ncbi:hypothetical protein [Flagellimonas flava]|uniref:Type I restriction enzyme, S subunit/type I restriction enzyme M protein n=1 Tax=Flagellimonas flava TaxID=570519 RepID=A0A1M5ISM0_9FLAO|nr:hypothetical protein [Allomuricauda flava]SHG30743.1 type I restriction enzyme, S subunit/type I restriction enzyme M protein [Allomuricauda flava]
MKSTNNKKNYFTIEDFEKGLILAGYVTPQTENELEELEALDDYDSSLAKERSITYFKRAVLAAEIVNALKEELTFGRVKFQKLVYLCEHACNMNLQERYAKFAAGPFDNNFMHSINKEFKKQKWFDIRIDNSKGYHKPIYSRTSHTEKYKIYYSRYFGEQNEAINKVIGLFRNTKTRQVELVATIYYCILEINENNDSRNIETLLTYFYKFDDSKKQFSKEEIKNKLGWMKENGIMPASK